MLSLWSGGLGGIDVYVCAVFNTTCFQFLWNLKMMFLSGRSNGDCEPEPNYGRARSEINCAAACPISDASLRPHCALPWRQPAVKSAQPVLQTPAPHHESSFSEIIYFLGSEKSVKNGTVSCIWFAGESWWSVIAFKLSSSVAVDVAALVEGLAHS